MDQEIRIFDLQLQELRRHLLNHLLELNLLENQEIKEQLKPLLPNLKQLPMIVHLTMVILRMNQTMFQIKIQHPAVVQVDQLIHELVNLQLQELNKHLPNQLHRLELLNQQVTMKDQLIQKLANLLLQELNKHLLNRLQRLEVLKHQVIPKDQLIQKLVYLLL